MYSEYCSFDELKNQVLTDSESTGLNVTTRNRYPIRFVLFDNFRDCSQFVDFVQTDMGAIVQSVDKWIDKDYPDLMITHTQLAEQIQNHIKKMNGANCVIAPFSELARFYENDKKKTFDALLKTIKATQTTPQASEAHQRVYVPIVGLEGKMETFSKDTQSTIWRLRSEDRALTYRLIITNGNTFGVKGLDKHYTVVNNIREWLNIWKDADKQVTPNIICTSKSIFANADFAQPDNAFVFATCSDAFKFLTKGLQLQFGGLSKVDSDGNNWEILAAQIDITNGFNFSKFVNHYFSIDGIDNYDAFIKLWFNNPGQFERWLLAKFYQLQQNENDFIYRSLSQTTTLSGSEFIEQMTLDLPEDDDAIAIRQYCLKEACKHHVVLREVVESTLCNKIQEIASKHNYTTAMKYFSGITTKEKELAISWLAKDLISIDQVRAFFPDLYYYFATPIGISVNIPDWLTPYMKAYKKAKIANVYTPEIELQINSLNQSEVSFDNWYQNFSTTRTLLSGRNDIEVLYWIDGLGIEWIPLIKEIIQEKNDQNIYLNDIKIARALLPSKTETNKIDLQKLLPPDKQLKKAGDLDNLAHQTSNIWPSTIIKEIELVREIIEEIISKYNGKKIAIISDHGLTYLSQLCDGLGLIGVESDHHGRIAIKYGNSWSTDCNYFRLEDNHTACALKHKSLCSKVPKGQGIHGGCTPEEVLVPVFIISNQADNTSWSSDILTLEINGTNPKVQFRIKNLPSIEIPTIEYNGIIYALHQIGTDLFESEPIAVDSSCNSVTLIIGNINKDYHIKISTEAQEDDLFGGF